MGGFVIAGLTGPLVTIGLGGEVTVIVVPTPRFRNVGGGLVRQGHKDVRGLHIDQQRDVTILRSIVVHREIPIEILQQISTTHETRLKILKKLQKAWDTATDLSVFIIKHNESKVTVTQHSVKKSSSQISVLKRFNRYIERAVSIHKKRVTKRGKDTQVLNTRNIIDDVEKADVLDIID